MRPMTVTKRLALFVACVAALSGWRSPGLAAPEPKTKIQLKRIRIKGFSVSDVARTLRRLAGREAGKEKIGVPITSSRFRVAWDTRTASILVRGLPSDFQLVTEFLAVLNTPADKPLPKLKVLRAFRLKHA